MTATAPRGHRRADLILLGVTAAWGLTFPAIKLAIAGISPLAFVAVRFLLSLVVLLLLWRRSFYSGWRGRHREGMVLGAILCSSYLLQAAGLQYTTASRSAFITGLSVSLVPLFYWPIRRRPPGLWPSLGAGACLAGLLLLTRPDLGRLNFGDILTLGTAVAYALYVILLESFTADRPAEPLIGLQTFWMTLFSLAIWWIAPGFGEMESGASGGATVRGTLAGLLASRPAMLGLAITVPVTIFTLVAMTRYQRRTTATRAGVIYSAEPVFALGFAALWLGERLDPSGLAGAALILLGLLAAVLS